ncbi:MAG: NAD+ synthase [Desulfonauticus sp.]|nr:NAD+ synthase [Desulfonauticus sp.]
MKIGVLQLNFWINDIEGNAAKILSAAQKTFNQGADLALTSELALLGYPPRDLLFRKQIIQRCREKLKELARLLKGYPPLVVGSPWENNNRLFNAAVILYEGKIFKWIGKTLLPNYDVFDEQRYFISYLEDKFIQINNQKIGITICEDIWKEFKTNPQYTHNPLQDLSAANVDIVLNLSASPFSIGKQKIREKRLCFLAQKYQLPIVYVNQVGGYDDLLFDGRSIVCNAKGTLVFRAKEFAEDIRLVKIPNTKKISFCNTNTEQEIFDALVMGLRDYVHKCGFKKVVLGLSGGIDSSLTAVIAATALGAKNVLGVLMPSCFTSSESNEDALALAHNLGIQTYILPIEDLRHTFSKTLQPIFKNLPPDVTEENIQARIRGNLLMAISNKFQALLLSTGNKSELAVGYCTIYGDMAGALAVISDIPKTMVYKICKWINAKQDLIPQRVLQKPPSAELRPNQKDQDSLPPYDLLDEILAFIIEKNFEPEEIINLGYNPEVVQKVYKMVRIAEFKRKQAPVGLKVSKRAFGTGWRMPIAAKI